MKHLLVRGTDPDWHHAVDEQQAFSRLLRRVPFLRLYLIAGSESDYTVRPRVHVEFLEARWRTMNGPLVFRWETRIEEAN